MDTELLVRSRRAASALLQTAVQQNIAIVGSVNLDAMAVTTTSDLRPVTASVVRNGSTVVAGLNGRRLLLGRPDRDRVLAAGGPHSHADVGGRERRPDVDAASEPSNRGTP